MFRLTLHYLQNWLSHHCRQSMGMVAMEAMVVILDAIPGSGGEPHISRVAGRGRSICGLSVASTRFASHFSASNESGNCDACFRAAYDPACPRSDGAHLNLCLANGNEARRIDRYEGHAHSRGWSDHELELAH